MWISRARLGRATQRAPWDRPRQHQWAARRGQVLGLTAGLRSASDSGLGSTFVQRSVTSEKQLPGPREL